MRTHKPTTEEVIRARALLSGFTIPELSERTGIKKNTFYSHLKSGNWRRTELEAIDRCIHFSADDIGTLLGRDKTKTY